MRLGAYPCALKAGTLAARALRPGPRSASATATATSSTTTTASQLRGGRPGASRAPTPSSDLVEMIELPDHPYFVGCQFHPEFKSKPFAPAPALRRLRQGRAGAPRRRASEARRRGHQAAGRQGRLSVSGADRVPRGPCGPHRRARGRRRAAAPPHRRPLRHRARGPGARPRARG